MQTTFPRLMLDHAKQRPTAPALREKVYGIWQTTTWADLALLVRRLACGLSHAGLKRGDHVVVVGENRPRLYAAMLAVQSLGAVPVPLYQDAAAPEYAFPISNAEIGYAIVEDQEQVDKMLELREQCPLLSRIWYDDPRGLRNYNEPGLDSVDALVAAGQPLRVAEDVLADPGQRHVGQHFLALVELVEGLAGGRAVEQRAVRVNHALGVAGGAAGEEHGGHVARLAARHFVVKQPCVCDVMGLAVGDQHIQCLQTRL